MRKGVEGRWKGEDGRGKIGTGIMQAHRAGLWSLLDER